MTEISDTQLEQSADEKIDNSFDEDHRVNIILFFLNYLRTIYDFEERTDTTIN